MSHPIDPKINALNALRDRIVQKFPEGGSGGTEAMMNVYRNASHIADAARALRDLHATRNPTETEGTHAKRIGAAVQRFTKEVEAARERVAKAAKEGFAGLESQIRAKTQLVPDAYAAEIRAVFRGMPSDERARLFTTLIDEKRGPEFAALIKVPRTLTGIPEQMREHYERAFVERHAPAEVIDRKGLQEAVETANVAVGIAAQVAAAYSNPGTLAEITKAEAEAAAAAKRFDATIAP